MIALLLSYDAVVPFALLNLYEPITNLHAADSSGDPMKSCAPATAQTASMLITLQSLYVSPLLSVLCVPLKGLNCLMQYFDIPASVLPVPQRPSLVLSAEAELGITAGLQDRVIQVFWD
eukprot:GHUV01036107.1.p1 GENE.GHUV01036107.1~~GHUV01036107.1.p1  ORF type:complete len:119 (-),score=31.68 GHUV01036107.1:368-724(-)